MDYKNFKKKILKDKQKYEQICKHQHTIDMMKVGIFNIGKTCGHWRDPKKSELPTVNLFKDSWDGTLCRLANSKFIGYGSIVVIVEDLSNLLDTLNAMRYNRCLRYKTKVILWNCRRPPNASYFRLSADLVRSCHLINVMLVHWNSEVSPTKFNCAEVIFKILNKPLVPLRNVMQQLFNVSHIMTANAELYIYSQHPCLAIIINSYYFTDFHAIREGSDQDVINLIREFKVAGIPYILLEDCSLNELLQIIEYLEMKDFSVLKTFILVIMSHGDEDDTLYTYDGQLNIKHDIVSRVQANATLRDVEKVILVNACRGSIDAEYADDDDLEGIQPTDNSHLSENTVVLYSVPNHMLSPRSPTTGSPFMQSFCHHMRSIKPNDDIRMVYEYNNNDLRALDYYYYFYGFENCFESLVRDRYKCHAVVTMPENALKMFNLLKTMPHDFPIQNRIGVCSDLYAGKYQNCDFTQMHFAKKFSSPACCMMGFSSDWDY